MNSERLGVGSSYRGTIDKQGLGCAFLLFKFRMLSDQTTPTCVLTDSAVFVQQSRKACMVAGLIIEEEEEEFYKVSASQQG